MTTVQEADINNALLVLMYEWKMGIIDQQQALKEFKQCLKYYSIVENILESCQMFPKTKPPQSHDSRAN